MKQIRVLPLLISAIFIFILNLFWNDTSIAQSANIEKYYYIKETKKANKEFFSTNDIQIYNRELIIKFKGDKKPTLEKYEVDLKNISPSLVNRGYRLVQVQEDENLDDVLEKLRNDPNVDYVEPNILKEQQEFSDDPLLSQQWYLQSVNVLDTWEMMNNNKEVRVAVIDSGVSSSHQDFSGKLNNGFNSISKNENIDDYFGHGTRVAGIIAANTNNSIGIAGINPNVSIIPIKVSEGGQLELINIINGIYKAIDNGAQIINMSYGAPVYSEAEYRALLEAYLRGIVLVAASGNDGAEVNYPAAYPFVISVGSVNKRGYKSTFSNYGNELDVMAPGEGIVTTDLNNSYVSVNGTSFASPVVSGVASLLLSEQSGLGPAQVQWLLENSTGTSWNPSTGFGKIDAYKMMTTNLPNLINDISNDSGTAKTITLNAMNHEYLQINDDIDWYSLSISKTTKLHIELGHPNNDLVLWLQKKNGEIVEWEEFVDVGNIGEGENYIIDATPGEYNIGVFDYNLRWSNESYSLMVKNLELKRIYGTSRIDTAIEISKRGWPNGLTHSEKAVIMARADNPADALAAAGLAGIKDAPILLTYPNSLSDNIKNEIRRLNANKIYLLGGPLAISIGVENDLKKLGIPLERVFGQSRFETAYAVNSVAGLGNSSEVLLVNGITVADALSASSISSVYKKPIYLASTNYLPISLPSSVKKVTILGGHLAISDGLEKSLNSKGIEVVRVQGLSRYETNINAVKTFASQDSFILVRGASTSTNFEDYPDAVTASGLANRMNAPIVLINPYRNEEVTYNYLKSHLNTTYVLGGELAIPNERINYR
ncbi:S8 family serine peptidase [Robertmurraya kyonggiensis]|uniref:S8 family serine peptidase n=1 Tax=Robertmurraya kyonggiensis TaxID=1037680 RepID=UPI00130EEB3A|nr:S8 family serine peptidase [Robertmurraya kyonggiensis]